MQEYAYLVTSQDISKLNGFSIDYGRLQCFFDIEKIIGPRFKSDSSRYKQTLRDEMEVGRLEKLLKRALLFDLHSFLSSSKKEISSLPNPLSCSLLTDFHSHLGQQSIKDEDLLMPQQDTRVPLPISESFSGIPPYSYDPKDPSKMLQESEFQSNFSHNPNRHSISFSQPQVRKPISLYVGKEKSSTNPKLAKSQDLVRYEPPPREEKEEEIPSSPDNPFSKPIHEECSLPYYSSTHITDTAPQRSSLDSSLASSHPLVKVSTISTSTRIRCFAVKSENPSHNSSSICDIFACSSNDLISFSCDIGCGSSDSESSSTPQLLTSSIFRSISHASLYSILSHGPCICVGSNDGSVRIFGKHDLKQRVLIEGTHVRVNFPQISKGKMMKSSSSDLIPKYYQLSYSSPLTPSPCLVFPPPSPLPPPIVHSLLAHPHTSNWFYGVRRITDPSQHCITLYDYKKASSVLNIGQSISNCSKASIFGKSGETLALLCGNTLKIFDVRASNNEISSIPLLNECVSCCCGNIKGGDVCLLGGRNGTVFSVDFRSFSSTRSPVMSSLSPSSINMMAHTHKDIATIRSICVLNGIAIGGTDDGNLFVLDALTLKPYQKPGVLSSGRIEMEKYSYQAHTGAISDIISVGNYVMSSGMDGIINTWKIY
ncbi:hypothetical protein ADUPG1_013633 [Aduncisulcus paluster]|uniref:Uncharacterized protein n=1 Tax=Aduncisulcus paluster TaxID=2918883 RepID=A0ABQ5K3P4_9EUKA|nr:hypothetical protein ADUPG1_013633 [Aduncisulcus paluster]